MRLVQNGSDLSKLALLLLRFIGHGECGMPIYFGRMECAPDSSSRPGGPTAKREPSPEGLGYRGTMTSAGGAALYGTAPPT
jgi:hypothetical protein